MRFNSLIQLSVLLFAPISALALHAKLEPTQNNLRRVAREWRPIMDRQGCDWSFLEDQIGLSYDVLYSYVHQAQGNQEKEPKPSSAIAQLNWIINRLNVLPDGRVNDDVFFNNVREQMGFIVREFYQERRTCDPPIL
ncbi:hypothetical protein FRC03_012598 [Tulasnella sp. 419]|nr:hypothetical protein FRC03_012598 [Tulasnella sp. 419]